jgi:RNA polymerase sigma-70 factor (ECF subfamily)
MTKLALPRRPEAEPLLDSLLVTMALAGDRRAASRLHARWHPRLLRTARRHTGDGELALSAVQDCWLSIWRGLPALRDTSRFAPWVFGILRRRCADQINRHSRERNHEVEAPETDLGHTTAPENRLAIAEAMAALSPVHRLAAHLFFVEGLTLAEIADVQQVPEGTAKSRLFHARRQLKAALSGDDQ